MECDVQYICDGQVSANFGHVEYTVIDIVSTLSNVIHIFNVIFVMHMY